MGINKNTNKFWVHNYDGLTTTQEEKDKFMSILKKYPTFERFFWELLFNNKGFWIKWESFSKHIKEKKIKFNNKLDYFQKELVLKVPNLKIFSMDGYDEKTYNQIFDSKINTYEDFLKQYENTSSENRAKKVLPYKYKRYMFFVYNNEPITIIEGHHMIRDDMKFTKLMFEGNKDEGLKELLHSNCSGPFCKIENEYLFKKWCIKSKIKGEK